MRKSLVLLLVVVGHFGVVSAASDNVQNRGGKLREAQWKLEMVRSSWDGKEGTGKCQEQR